jgi:hypothetical protein
MIAHYTYLSKKTSFKLNMPQPAKIGNRYSGYCHTSYDAIPKSSDWIFKLGEKGSQLVLPKTLLTQQLIAIHERQ